MIFDIKGEKKDKYGCNCVQCSFSDLQNIYIQQFKTEYINYNQKLEEEMKIQMTWTGTACKQ